MDSLLPWPAVRGGLLALLAAVLFGISAPLVQRFGHGVGPLSTAALLYAGASLAGAGLRRPSGREARVRRADLSRLAWMAAFGAGVGPVAFAWGLQRTSATGASLMLTLEAVFTAVIARAVYHEAIGRRAAVALWVLTAGGMLLVLDGGRAGPWGVVGLWAVLAATAAWGVDNALSRPLAERDPGQVVMIKGALGAAATTLLALALGEQRPTLVAVVGLLAVGATGYGWSLRFYLLAQRAFGVARTGSVFAFAPFVGATLAVLLGERSASAALWTGCGLMLAGIVLHITEQHAHEHLHASVDHEHAHRHDDPHHNHPHEPRVGGVHSHAHHHPTLRHTHAHVPDEHHGHTHGT